MLEMKRDLKLQMHYNDISHGQKYKLSPDVIIPSLENRLSRHIIINVKLSSDVINPRIEHKFPLDVMSLGRSSLDVINIGIERRLSLDVISP